VTILGAPLPWIQRDARLGLYYTQLWRGLRVVRVSTGQLARARDFAAAVLAIKWLDPGIIAAAMDANKGSPSLWRDQLMSQIYGTAFALTDAEGKTIYPRQFVEKVTRALDLLGAETGALLVRAPGQWQTLAPGAPGFRLTSNGPGTTPTWR
jgi:hypothetical protein